VNKRSNPAREFRIIAEYLPTPFSLPAVAQSAVPVAGVVHALASP